MAYEVETRFVYALMNGVALTDCPEVYQILMGMALSIAVNDRKLGRPLSHFSQYLLDYAREQWDAQDRRQAYDNR